MSQLFDPQMANVADFDCFSQVIFKDIEDYKRFKQDSWYKKHLMRDHENFADTKRSMYVSPSFTCTGTSQLISNRMTIGWVEEFVKDGEEVDGFQVAPKVGKWQQGTIWILLAASLAGLVYSWQRLSA